MQTTKLNSELLFTEQEMRDKRWEQFKSTQLGKLFLTIPFKEIASRYPVKKNKCGAKGFFSVEGGIGLMFLKSYYKSSDEKLFEQFNLGNWGMQWFCGMRLGKDRKLKTEASSVAGAAFWGLI